MIIVSAQTYGNIVLITWMIISIFLIVFIILDDKTIRDHPNVPRILFTIIMILFALQIVLLILPCTEIIDVDGIYVIDMGV